MQWLTLSSLFLLPTLTMGCETGTLDFDPNDATDFESDSDVTDSTRLLCDDTGAFDFHAKGTGFDEYEGRAVWAAAFEAENNPYTDSINVLLASTITFGSYDMACPNSLTENYRYPSYAVVIDADGSGDCTPDDLAAVGQFYGWGSDQRFVAHGTEGQDATHGIPVTFERIGASKTWGDRTFCEVYVPTEMLD